MKNFSLSYPKLINFFVYLLPLSFIFGNLFVNIEIMLVSIAGIFFYKKEIFNIKGNSIFILIIIFFVILILSTILESYKNPEGSQFEKSILFLRYLVFFAVLRCMVLKNHLDLKGVLLSCLFFSSFVSLDIIFQYFYGVNIFGFGLGEEVRLGSTRSYASGVFGEEFVAGGYLQRFFVLGFFSIPLFFKKSKIKILALFLLPTLCFLAIIFSGNRMPVFMFVIFITMLLFVLSFKKLKYVPQFTLIFFATILIFLISNFENFHKPMDERKYEEIRMNFMRFLGGIPQPSKIIRELKRDYPELEKYKNSRKPFHMTEEWKKEKAKGLPEGEKDIYELYQYRTGYVHLYITSIDLIVDNPFIGRGIKSFRNTCWEKVYLPNRICQNHPHNFYLEILNDTGIVGLAFILIPILLLLLINYKKYNNKSNLFFYPFFFSLIIEFFPFRSTGNFFSTSNAAFIFFLLGIFIGLKELKNKKSSISYNFF